MNRKNSILTIIILCVFTLFSIVGCSQNNESKEKELVSNFTKTFFTEPGDDMDIFKKYLTETAYQSLTNDRYASSRIQYTPSIQGNMEGLEISDLNIEPIEDENKDYHYYNVSFSLKDTKNDKSIEIQYKISLEKEKNNWKIGMNNQFHLLTKSLWGIWEN